MGALRFLYEAIPDKLPYGFLSDVEVGLWARHFESRKK